MKTTVLPRLLALLLMLCMLVSVFAACVAEDDDTDSDSVSDGTEADGSSNGAPVDGPETDENGYILDGVDITLDREISILYSQHIHNDICPKEEEVGENVVAKSLYDRWQNVQDRLNVEIQWIPEPGQWDSSKTTFAQKVQTNSETGSAFDAVVCYNLLPGLMASKGLLQNLIESDHIDLTMPWWPQAYLNEAVVNDTLYGIVESSSKTTLNHLHGTFFNNDLIEDYKLTSPYEYVKNNTWTFDNMMALIKDVGSDKNNNGTKDKDDFFGLVTGTEAKIETWFFAMGYRYSQKTANGEIELLLSDSNMMIEWIDRFNDATATKDFLIYDQNGHTKAFFENRAILYMTSLVMVNSMISQEIQMDYGVVPVPKGSESQERYISNVANHHTQWCVPVNAYDFQESTAVIEVMSSESYRTVAPMYFDTCVKLRYAPDERLYDMYDMIRDSITFDFCQTYTFVFDSEPRGLITKCTKGTANWASQWESVGSGFESGFANILTLYGLG